MLKEPLSAAAENAHRAKLVTWHPQDPLQEERLDELEQFLKSEHATAEVIAGFRVLYDFLLNQSIATHEIDREEQAAGRKNFPIDMEHPLMQAMTKPNVPPDLTAPMRGGVTMIVNHLREGDLQRRALRLKEILEAAEKRVIAAKDATK